MFTQSFATEMGAKNKSRPLVAEAKDLGRSLDPPESKTDAGWAQSEANGYILINAGGQKLIPV